jgi:hypothetical protein
MSIWPRAMSYSRPSSDNDRVGPVIACRVAAQGVEFRRGTWVETEPLSMMRPPARLLAFHHVEGVLNRRLHHRRG